MHDSDGTPLNRGHLLGLIVPTSKVCLIRAVLALVETAGPVVDEPLRVAAVDRVRHLVCVKDKIFSHGHAPRAAPKISRSTSDGHPCAVTVVRVVRTTCPRLACCSAASGSANDRRHVSQYRETSARMMRETTASRGMMTLTPQIVFVEAAPAEGRLSRVGALGVTSRRASW